MTNKDTKFSLIKLDDIDAPANASRFDPDDEAITNLAQSIHSLGLLQPIVVTPIGDRYRLVAGNRRCRAFRMLGEELIPAHIVPLPSADEALATITENLQRAQLRPLEEAAALQDLLDNHAISQTDLAELLSVDRTWIAHRLQLLRLSDELQDAIVHNDLAPSIALELDRVTDPESRTYYLGMVVNSGATLNTVREWVRAWISYQMPTPTPLSSDTPVERPPAPEPPPPPSCLVCGLAPPQVQLRVSYLCWTCERALRNAPKEQ